MALGVEGETRQLADHLAGQRVEGGQAFHLVVEQLDADRLQLRLGRIDVDHIAAYPEGGAGEVHVVARVLQLGQPTQQFALVEFVAAVDVQDHLQVRLGIAQAVDRRHRGDDDRVRPLEQRLGGRQAHLLDVVVDRGVLLDVGIRGRHVGFRLVVVVVGDEVLHRVVGEEAPELAVQLRRQGLVGRQHQGRALHLGDHVGDAEGLARAGHAEQGLVRQPRLETLDHLADRFRLVAGRLEAGNKVESGHERTLRGQTPAADEHCRQGLGLERHNVAPMAIFAAPAYRRTGMVLSIISPRLRNPLAAMTAGCCIASHPHSPSCRT
ncbi:hypothetical protein D3C78_1054910 [compost metagenome]